MSRLAPPAALLAGLFALIAPAAPARAESSAGYCTDDRGVTVVVDFNQIGGGVIVRCAQDLPAGGSGADALRAAGISFEGTRRWGDGFVCRIEGRPAADTDLTVNGDPGYREQCVDTPPSGAYWSYWHATNGGSWTYSQAGVRNRTARAGGFEGWSFSLDSADSPPGAAPTRPAPPPPPTQPPAAEPVTTPAAPLATPPPGSTPPPTTPRGISSATDIPGRAGERSPAAGAAAADPAGSPSATGQPSSGGTDPSSSVAAAGSSNPGGTATAAPGAPAPPADPVALTSATGQPPVGTLLGAAALAFLVTTGIGTAWLRRRRS